MRINKDDILEALGFESGGGFFVPALIGFGVGALLGAGAALLLAPKKGSEMRDQLIGRAREMVGRGERAIDASDSTAPNEPRHY